VIPNALADYYAPPTDYLARSPAHGLGHGPGLARSDEPQRAYLVPASASPSPSPHRRDAHARTLGLPRGGSPSFSGGSPYRQAPSAIATTLPRFAPQPDRPSAYLTEWEGAPGDAFPNPLREYGYPSDYGLPLARPSPDDRPTYPDDVRPRHGPHLANLSHSSGKLRTLFGVSPTL